MAPAQAASTSTKAVKLDGSQSLTKPSGSKSNKAKADKKDKTQKKRKVDEDDEDDSDSDVDFVNVDLDFFSFIESDYQALKHLLTQLFSHDAKDLDIAALADHLIEQEEEVGSAIKSDGEESDPLAFVGIFPWQSDKPYIESLRNYILKKTSSSGKIQSILADSSKRIGVVVSERLINMPVQVVPHLLRIFDEEMDNAGEAFAFTHLLFISKVFLATADDFDDDEEMPLAGAPTKKKKKANKGSGSKAETFLYHLEDEIIAQFSVDGDAWTEYSYSNAPKRGEVGPGEDFGVETRGRVSLVERSRLKDIVKEADKVLSS